jgi:uncharacterized membrane protein YidH (DUF202 family)
MSGDAPFDPGLQPERTLLAWRRTALALGVAAVAAAAFAYLAAALRYRRTHAALTAAARLPGDGAALAAVAATAAMFALGGLCYVGAHVLR